MLNKIKIERETINRILEGVKPLQKGDAEYVRIDFGTGSIEGKTDEMRNRVILTGSTEQGELGFISSVPEEMGRELSSCTVEQPLESAAFKIADFISVFEALSAYERAFVVDVLESKMHVDVHSSKIDLNKVPLELVKKQIPNKQNCTDICACDTDVLIFSTPYDAFKDAVKNAGALNKLNGVSHYTMCLRDAEEVRVEKECPDHSIKSVIVSNGQLQMAAISQHTLASGVCSVKLKKGAAKQLLPLVIPKEELKDAPPTIVSFKKETKEGEDGKEEVIVVPSGTSYEEYKAAYEKVSSITAEPEEYFFGVAVGAIDTILQLASVARDSVDVTLGMKYMTVSFANLGMIYTVARTPLSSNKNYMLMQGILGDFDANGQQVTVSLEDFVKGSRLQLLKLKMHYQKADYVDMVPFALCITEKGITITCDDAESHVEAVSAKTNIAETVLGIRHDYLTAVIGSLPAGNLVFWYGLERPIMMFTKGDESAFSGNTVIVAGVENVDAQRKLADKKREEDLKKEAEKKK